MAIQTINLTVPGGDTPRSANTKINANFSNQTHAASRLVGTAKGNVMEVGAFGLGGAGVRYNAASDLTRAELGRDSTIYNFLGTGLTATYTTSGSGDAVYPEEVKNVSGSGFSSLNFFDYVDFSTNTRQGRIIFVAGHLFTQKVNRDDLSSAYSATWGEVFAYYHTGNTTKDSNGFLKAASPIVKVFADKVELNTDAIDQNVTYKKNGVGDYTITTVSGLSTDGWYIELPKDMNGNPKVAVTLEETDGVISLKSYRRIFSMETFTFEPDLDNPLDIPDGRWIDLRLNEIPVEEVVNP